MTEKQPKTCEEYVLNELYSTQNKVAVVSKELQETKEVLGIESALHKELFELITRVCSGGEIEENKNGMISLYLKGKYIGSYFSGDKDSQYLEPLKTLIEMVETNPRREK